MSIYKFDSDNLNFVKIKHHSKWIISLLLVALMVLFGVILTMKVEKKIIRSEMMIILTEKDRFTEDRLIELIKRLNFKYPEIVYAQAILESGHFKSRTFIENNNLFGMKEPTQRVNISSGSQNDYAYYKTWQESVIDYAFYSATYLSKIPSQEEYFNYLAQFYAEDPDYVKKLKNVIQQINSKFNE